MLDLATTPPAAVSGAHRASRSGRIAAGLLASILLALTILGSAAALRTANAAEGPTVASGRIESFVDLGRTSEAFVAPAASKPVLRALPRSGFALWLLLLAALATLAATAGLKPRHGTPRDARAIAVLCGAARLPRRRGPPHRSI